LYAANRAAQLLQELAGGEVLKGTIDVYPSKLPSQKIALRVSRTNAVLGTSFSQSDIVGFLRRLHVKVVKQSKDLITFLIPGFRYDLVEEIDLIEEEPMVTTKSRRRPERR
jgi:phenylalanyl-tRNA synthetase beta chain